MLPLGTLRRERELLLNRGVSPTGATPTMMREAKEVSVGKWQLDPYHTQVEHLGMMTVRATLTSSARRPTSTRITRSRRRSR